MSAVLHERSRFERTSEQRAPKAADGTGGREPARTTPGTAVETLPAQVYACVGCGARRVWGIAEIAPLTAEQSPILQCAGRCVRPRLHWFVGVRPVQRTVTWKRRSLNEGVEVARVVWEVEG